MDFGPVDFAALGVHDGRAVFRRVAARALRPPPELDIPEWAERVRHIPPDAAFPGPWRNDRAPYLVEPMRALSPSSPVERVVLMFGSQIGKTEVLLNTIGHALDVRPATVLVVLPDKTQIRKWSRTRLDTLIRDSPGLRSRVTEKQREKGNTLLLKSSTNGTFISLVGANSGNDLRSTAARVILGDELDGWNAEIVGEGDPLQLALRAAKTFEGQKKIGWVSTPTIKGHSRIEGEYLRTDRSVYLVPCPHCEFRQLIGWTPRKEIPWPQSRMEWDRGDYTSVRATCAGCGQGIEEGWKTEMLAAGEWTAERPHISERRRGFWLSGLYAPLGWYSWRTAAEEWEEATGTSTAGGLQDEGGKRIDTIKLRTFVNTVLSESYAEKGEAPPWELLHGRREKYPVGTVPAGALVLTAGVDVQKNRLEFEVVGWGRDLESWSVDYVEIPGDPTKPEVWKELWKALARPYPWARHRGATLTVRRSGVDTGGHATNDVYAAIRRQSSERVLAMKGRDSYATVLGTAKPVDVTSQGKVYRRGLRLWTVGVSMVKAQLYSWMRMDPPREGEPFPPGWCHFPEYGENHFRGLCSEELKVTKNREGRLVYEWVVKYERNEPLDCRVYAYATAVSLHLDRYKPSEWDALEASLAPVNEAPPAPKQQKRELGPLDRRLGRRLGRGDQDED